MPRAGRLPAPLPLVVRNWVIIDNTGSKNVGIEQFCTMKWLFPILFCAVLQAADLQRITYSKSFPGSVPAFVAITIDQSGAGEYKEAPDDDAPLKFHVRDSEIKEIFDLTDKLDRFKRSLESPLKVAFMGMKTFRLESGTEKAEVKFNFSEDPAARDLADCFEKISESAQHRINLERTAKYDKLGVMKALLQFESAWDRKRVVAPDQFLPVLDRISKNETYLHEARLRAAKMAETIRATK